MLPDELCGGRLALSLGVPQGGEAFVVEQLGVGLGSQQGLHARLLTSAGGRHQGGAAFVGLQVGVGRVLQENAQNGEVATTSSIHERGGTKLGLQVDARTTLQQLPHHLQLVAGCGAMQQGYGCGPTATSRNRADRVDRPFLSQPLDHLLQLAPLRRP